jgi:hypothetical protein
MCWFCGEVVLCFSHLIGCMLSHPNWMTIVTLHSVWLGLYIDPLQAIWFPHSLTFSLSLSLVLTPSLCFALSFSLCVSLHFRSPPPLSPSLPSSFKTIIASSTTFSFSHVWSPSPCFSHCLVINHAQLIIFVDPTSLQALQNMHVSRFDSNNFFINW